jgi:hypothetical protein
MSGRPLDLYAYTSSLSAAHLHNSYEQLESLS